VIEHIAHFVAYLWQIHIFGEGNTRTTAVFLIKYLRKLGFKDINNDLFAEHSWYFRNALVRANYEDITHGINKTDKYLIRFLSNLLLKENNILKNRELNINFVAPVNDTVKDKDTVNGGVNDNDTVNDTVISLIKKDNKITTAKIAEILHIGIATVKREIKRLKDEGIISREGADKNGQWIINTNDK
jgi:predicted HTH transcriptional regulator